MTIPLAFRGKLLLLIFAMSGVSGLIYQSIWSHYLGLLLGHSSYAQVLVLALFMGGMALGAWLASLRSDSLARPLRSYCYVELALGVFGVVFHSSYLLVSTWAYDTLYPLLDSGLPLDLARWSIAGLMILPQCVLLGATFPLMSAGFIRWQPASSGNILAGLYFSNSIGASMGALASTFYLLPAVGLPGTVLTAGLLNMMIAIAVWPLSRYSQPLPSKLTSGSHQANGNVPLFILLAACVTGASSFMYEISWVRMLSMVLGSTIHAFELMLATFIAGIAFGGLWLRKRADRLASPRRAAGYAQIAMGCAALSTLATYNQSFSWLAYVMQALNRSSESAYLIFNLAGTAISAIIMFPAAFFAGMTLPLLTLTLLKDGHGEPSIGRAYAANTLGAIIGVIFAVGIALPLLGLRLTLWVAAGADIVLGALLLVNVGMSPATPRSTLSRAGVTTIAAGLAALFLTLNHTHFDRLLMSSSVFRFGNVDGLGSSEREVLFHKDGRTATVALVEAKSEGLRSILTNGKADASISFKGEASSDEITMMLAGVLPMLHNPDVRSVAIIGFGSGMTTHTVLGNAAVESVDTIEIEPAMVEAAREFRPRVDRAYADARSHILIDDAKSFVSTNRRKYDIIISEPSNPWVNGVASLFTREFYAFVPKHLNEDGVFAQWIQAYELSPVLMISIVRAMLPYFADVKLYSAGPTDWLLVASPKRQLPHDAGLSLPSSFTSDMRQELHGIGIETGEETSLLFAGDRRVLTSYAMMYPGSGINSDYFPILQLGSPLARFNGSVASELLKLRLADWPVFEAITGIQPSALDTRLPDYLVRNNALAFTTHRARNIRGILEGSIDSRNGSIPAATDRYEIETLSSAASTCRLDAMGSDGLLLLARVAAKTIPYLDAATGTQLWKQAKWMACPARNKAIRNYLEFIAAIASRNHNATWTIGASILADPDQLRMIRRERAVLDYLVGGMQVAAAISGRRSDALKLEEQYGPELSQSFVRSYVLRSPNLTH